MDPHQQSLAIAASWSLVTDSHISHMYAASQGQQMNKAKQAVIQGEIGLSSPHSSVHNILQWSAISLSKHCPSVKEHNMSSISAVSGRRSNHTGPNSQCKDEHSRAKESRVTALA